MNPNHLWLLFWLRARLEEILTLKYIYSYTVTVAIKKQSFCYVKGRMLLFRSSQFVRCMIEAVILLSIWLKKSSVNYMVEGGILSSIW